MPVKGFVILTLIFRKDGRVWTGECLELGTATYGRNLEKAHEELAELVELHLNCLEKNGERERFFKANNIKFYSDETVPAEVKPPKVPLDESAYMHLHRVSLPTPVHA